MKVSEITAFLEKAYEVLNVAYYDGGLPPVVITVQSSPKTYGHYTPWESWHEGQGGFKEINLSAENLDRPIEHIIATLQHEMVHSYCDLNGIKDTSRGGTYHNKRFKEQAELRDLIIDYDPKIGYSLTTPSDSLKAFVVAQGWSDIDLSRNELLSPFKGKGKGNQRKYQCPVCGCSVRATKAVNIACMDCQAIMELQ